MNFKDAISAHVNWKIRLRMFLNGTGEKIESAVVGRDNLCELGKWIYGLGFEYSHLPSYQTMKTEHTNFHRYAGDVVRKIETGDKQGAETLLNGEQFSVISNKMVVAIMEMERSYK